jgi:hypothetical protein
MDTRSKMKTISSFCQVVITLGQEKKTIVAHFEQRFDARNVFDMCKNGIEKGDEVSLIVDGSKVDSYNHEEVQFFNKAR